MMPEFRAWCKDYGKYAVVRGWDNNEFVDVEFEPYAPVKRISMDAVVIEQYIERRDNKGQPIYEGDFVKNVSGQNTDQTWEVKRLNHDEYVGFSAIEINAPNRPGYFLSWDNMVVVGNRNVNPELTQPQKE